jgi:CheY-like chemotaxis protein
MVAMENRSFCPGASATSVLVVEDEMVSRTAMALLLRASGYTPVIAASAEEALRLLNNGPMPRIALVDLDLPGMNGVDLIRELRTRGKISALLVTAASRDKVEALTKGTVPLLRKPVDFRHLLSLLAEQ